MLIHHISFSLSFSQFKLMLIILVRTTASVCITVCGEKAYFQECMTKRGLEDFPVPHGVCVLLTTDPGKPQ